MDNTDDAEDVKRRLTNSPLEFASHSDLMPFDQPTETPQSLASGMTLGFQPSEASQPTVPSDDLTWRVLDVLSEDLTRKDRIEIITQLDELVREIRSKGLVHGSIQPSHLEIARSDGEIRTRFLHYPTSKPKKITRKGRYKSAVPHYDSFLESSDDSHAAGISMWEIYTGLTAFSDIPDEHLSDAICALILPDLSLIDNPDIERRITERWDVGYSGFDQEEMRYFRMPSHCINVNLVYQSCLNRQSGATPHRNWTTIQCELCIHGMDCESISLEGAYSCGSSVYEWKHDAGRQAPKCHACHPSPPPVPAPISPDMDQEMYWSD